MGFCIACCCPTTLQELAVLRLALAEGRERAPARVHWGEVQKMILSGIEAICASPFF